MKKEKRFCPKCGKQLLNSLIPNETPYIKGYMGHTWIEIDNAFNVITGEKLYRVESDCPTLEGKFIKKSHYGIYAEKGITEKEARDRFYF